jgi:hypothetical protein
MKPGSDVQDRAGLLNVPEPCIERLPVADRSFALICAKQVAESIRRNAVLVEPGVAVVEPFGRALFEVVKSGFTVLTDLQHAVTARKLQDAICAC